MDKYRSSKFVLILEQDSVRRPFIWRANFSFADHHQSFGSR